jgi:hypothetical protein
MVFSVKGGKLSPVHVRELRGVIARENAAMGALLTLHKPRSAMVVEAANAGFHESHWGRHPRIQLLTAQEVLDGRGLDYPGANVSGVKKARHAPPRHEQMSFPGLASARSPSSPPPSAAKRNKR